VAFQVPITRDALHRFLRLELISGNGMIVPAFQPGEAATVHVEWTFDGAILDARVTSDRPLDLLVLLNGCLQPATVAAVTAESASLEQSGWVVHAGVQGQRKGEAAESSLERLEARLRGLPLVASDAPHCVAGHCFRLRPGVLVHLSLAEVPVVAEPRRIEERLEAGRLAMQTRQMRSAGAADWVEEPGAAAWLRAEAERVAARLREQLFDPEVGYYQNRFFDGHFSSVKTMDLFYPLLAEVCNDSVRDRLHAMLLDPLQFWGENVIPTVSRDDPAYGDEVNREPYWKGNYWRGNIWPPTNYITYLSVRMAGWTDVASEISAKSRRLFMEDWLPRHHANENYPPEGGTARTWMFAGNGGRDPHYLWAGLLPLIALEELFAVEDVGEGLRFGSLDPLSWGAWEGFLYGGRRGSVCCNANGLSLEIADWLRVTSDGPIAVREFRREGARTRFRYSAQKPVALEIVWDGRQEHLNLPKRA